MTTRKAKRQRYTDQEFRNAEAFQAFLNAGHTLKYNEQTDCNPPILIARLFLTPNARRCQYYTIPAFGAAFATVLLEPLNR